MRAISRSGDGRRADGFCNACFTGRYPIEVSRGPAEAGLRGRAGMKRAVVIGSRRPGGGDRLGVPSAHGPRRRPSPPTLSDARRRTDGVDLVIVGPEAALAAGVADAAPRVGDRRASARPPTLARLETSKGFTRALAAQLGLPVAAVLPQRPSPTTRSRGGASSARPVVVKLDGLAAGKGVIVPDDAGRDRRGDPSSSAAAGRSCVEERLSGPECSLMALCDGASPARCRSPRTTSGSARATPARTPAAWAPTPRRPCGYDADELTATFIQPVLDHLAARRHAVRRRAVRRADAHRRRARGCSSSTAASATPRRRRCCRCSTSDLAELALACCHGQPGRRADSTVRDGAALHRRRRRAGLPGDAGARRADQRPRRRRPTTTDAGRDRVPGRHRRRASSPAAACSPSPGSAPTSPRPATNAYARMSTDPLRRACRCAATSAGGPSAPTLGVVRRGRRRHRRGRAGGRAG